MTIQAPNSQPQLQRWLALLVRYWAYNMNLIHSRGINWPGFRYNDAEKARLQSIAAAVPGLEYYFWLTLVVVIYIVIAVIVVIAGMSCLMHAIGGEQNMFKTPAPLFFLQLALDMVVSVSIGLPAAMLPAAALTGRLFKVADADLPDLATTAHYFHKLWFQITRVTILGVFALMALWVFVPTDSKLWVIAQIALPLLSPAVAALTAAYYFTARLKSRVRSAPSDTAP